MSGWLFSKDTCWRRCGEHSNTAEAKTEVGPPFKECDLETPPKIKNRTTMIQQPPLMGVYPKYWNFK